MPVLGAAARRHVEGGGGGPAAITRPAGALPRFMQVGRCALSGKRGAEGGREGGSEAAPLVAGAGCGVRAATHRSARCERGSVVLGVGSAWLVLHGAGRVSPLCPAGDREVLKEVYRRGEHELVLQLRVLGTARASVSASRVRPPRLFFESVRTFCLLKACFVQLSISGLLCPLF